jgi:hypothetical protein
LTAAALPQAFRLRRVLHSARMRTVACLLVFTAAGCASGEQRAGESTHSRPSDGGKLISSQMAPAPRWISEYCSEVGRKIKRAVLCPARVPLGISPTENLKGFRPTSQGYVFEAEAEQHWVFVASPFELQANYGRMRVLGSVEVRGRPGRWLYAPPTGGIHAHHLVLTWRERGFHYAMSVHTKTPSSERLRSRVLRVAEGMRLYP